ncbi:MAG TPA: SDR family oxidoreductase [Gemmatimonadales bacterium]|nr:SDR family oxidoreductase [Gemmatimonadales bacterium]
MRRLRRIWSALRGTPPPAPRIHRVAPPAVSPSTRQTLFPGRGAVIIGAGPNIGLGIAQELAREGASLLLTNASAADLEMVSSPLQAEGVLPLTLVSDVREAGAADALLDMIEHQRFPFDLLVLNAGIHSVDRPPTAEEALEVFHTNTVAPVMLARRAATCMRHRSPPGSIVFINSIHSGIVRGDAYYSASKAALKMATRELALELAPLGIRVNSIAPGWVATAPEGGAVPHRLTPLYQTSTTPEAIGRAVVFLASHAWSPHTTGAMLTVDGGASLVGYATPSLPPLPEP